MPHKRLVKLEQKGGVPHKRLVKLEQKRRYVSQKTGEAGAKEV